jgi:hypothetical protein
LGTGSKVKKTFMAVIYVVADNAAMAGAGGAFVALAYFVPLSL